MDAKLDILAAKMAQDYPYGHEPWGLKGTIKLILWVLATTNVLKVK